MQKYNVVINYVNAYPEQQRDGKTPKEIASLIVTRLCKNPIVYLQNDKTNEIFRIVVRRDEILIQKDLSAGDFYTDIAFMDANGLRFDITSVTQDVAYLVITLYTMFVNSHVCKLPEVSV